MSEDHCKVENLQSTSEELSPSGRFKLVIRSYSAKTGGYLNGAWNYSRGTVYRISDGQEICDIKRNFHHFAHSFVNKGGQEWLISGRSYMSQTIVNLDTGQEFEPPGDQEDPYAFCWVSAKLSPDEKVLMVAGCIWACPYEFTFYDFSDPSKGWPRLPVFQDGEETYIEFDDRFPELQPNGTIICRGTKRLYLPLNKFEDDIDWEKRKDLGKDYDDPSNWKEIECWRLTLKREDEKLVITDTWLSDEEHTERQKREESRLKFEAWEKNFKATDPLYLKYRELLKANPDWPIDKYEACGRTHADWCSTFKGNETLWCRRIIEKSASNHTVDLEWAVDTGPIKLRIFHHGKSSEDKFFDHSAEGMIQAFVYVKRLVRL